MNVERLTEIAEWLEAGAPHKGNVLGFNMNYIALPGDCGTLCCIAGAAAQFFAPDGLDISRDSDVTEAARRALGISEQTSDELFWWRNRNSWEKSLSDIDAYWAARTIRHLIATGEVDWEATRVAP